MRATRVSLFSTMSMKLASTFTLRPRTVWVPFIEVSQPYGTKLKVHPDGAAIGATTGGGGGGGKSAASTGPPRNARSAKSKRGADNLTAARCVLIAESPRLHLPVRRPINQHPTRYARQRTGQTVGLSPYVTFGILGRCLALSVRASPQHLSTCR